MESEDFSSSEADTSDDIRVAVRKRKETLIRGGVSKTAKKKRDKTKKFNVKWLSMPEFKDWVEPVSGDVLKVKCKACSSYVKCGKSELQKHLKGQGHQKNVKLIQCTPNIKDMFAASHETASHVNAVKSAEIKLSMFFAEHNVAIQAVDHLVPLLKSAFPDSKILKDLKMHRTKCSSILRNIVGKVEEENLVAQLKTCLFSVLVDGSTDISTQKLLCVLVRYISPLTGKVRTQLLELIKVDARDCSAAALFGEFEKCLQEKGIPIKNVVGLATDNENTMTGSNNSFFSRLKEVTGGNVVLMRCVCHSVHLAASKGCKKIPHSIEELLRSISTYVSASGKRSAQLQEIQEFMELEKHKILKPAETRWLSLHACILRILELWEALKHFFTIAVFEDDLKSSDLILTQLQNPFAKGYLLFLKQALVYFNSFNALFQSKSVLIHKLWPNCNRIFKQLCQNFIRPECLTDNVNVSHPSNFLPLDEIFIGPECEQWLQSQNVSAKDIEEFRKVVLSFYVTSAAEVQTRLPLNSLFKAMQFLDPEIALCTNRKFDDELQELCNAFPEYTSPNEVVVQWRNLPWAFSDDEKKEMVNMTVDEMWHKISNSENFEGTKPFSDIGRLAQVVLTLPHSNAEAERIFSVVTDVKCKKRNKISPETLNAIAMVRSNLQASESNCYTFSVLPQHLQLHQSSNLYGNNVEADSPSTSK